MRPWRAVGLVVAAAMTLGGVAAADKAKEAKGLEDEQRVGFKERIDVTTEIDFADPGMDDINTVLATWPEASARAARDIIGKYGTPDGLTPHMLVWVNNGPWKRTIVHKLPAAHNFPTPHVDVVEQFVDLRVPVDRVDDLAAFDGSVVVNRTAGEVSARCDNEAANFLALNLARDIARGDLSALNARAEYTREILAKMRGEETRYLSGLKFKTQRGVSTADPDRSSFTAASKRAKGGGAY